MVNFNEMFANLGVEVTEPTAHLESTSWLLYGGMGCGKSSVAATASKVEELQDVLFLDLENGSLPVSEWGDPDHVTILNIKSWDDMSKVFKWIVGWESEHTNKKGEVEPFPFKTIVIDTIDKMQDYIYAKWEKGGDGFDAWRQVYEQAMRIVDTLHHDSGLTVIAITHADRQANDLTGEDFIRPSFEGKKSDRKMAQVFDFVAYMEWREHPETEKLYPVMVTRTADDIEAKRRINDFPDVLWNPSFARIMELLHEAVDKKYQEEEQQKENNNA